MTDPTYPMPPAPQPKSHKVRNVLLTIVAVIVIISIAANAGKKKDATTPASGPTTTAGVTSSTTSSSTAAAKTTKTSAPKPDGSDPKQDVTIASCKTGDGGYLSASVRITNHSSKPSNYIVNVIFESKDGKEQLDTGLAAVNELAPGQLSNQDASAFKEAPAGGYVCKVGDVTRYAS